MSLYFGAGLDTHYTGTKSPGDNNAALNAYAALVGKQPSIEVWGHTVTGSPPFTNEFTITRNSGRIPCMTMGFPTVASLCDVITAGTYDAEMISSYIAPVVAHGAPVIFRPLWEMSGNWYPWAANANGNTPAKYVAAWRHIVDLFRAHGASNVSWFWCAYVQIAGVGQTQYATYNTFYPGDAYVDFTGFDAYPPLNSSVTPWELMQPIYQTIKSFSGRPMIIGEWGVRDDAGGVPTQGKAAYITQFFDAVKTNMPLVKAHLYYDVNEPAEGGATGFPLNSSVAATNAYAAGVADSIYLPNNYATLTGSTVPVPAPYTYISPQGGVTVGNYLNLPSGGGASTPHQSSLNSGTSTIDLRVKVLPNTWNPGVTSTLITQSPVAGAPTNYHWWFGILASGTLYAEYVNSAVSIQGDQTTVVPTFAAGQPVWVRALFTITSGILQFFQSPDDTTYTQIGTNRVITTTALQTATTSAVTLGYQATPGAVELPGKYYRARVLLGGASTLDMDFSTATVGTGPWTATTTETWTRAGTSTVIAETLNPATAGSGVLSTAQGGGRGNLRAQGVTSTIIKKH